MIGADTVNLLPVSKATLDIICATAFGYTSDSLHNPHNELAEAYDVLTSSQNGTYHPPSLNHGARRKALIAMFELFAGKNLARFIFLVSIPGVTRLLASRWATENRHVFAWFAFTGAAPLLPLSPSPNPHSDSGSWPRNRKAL
jgi:hypothetical protein